MIKTEDRTVVSTAAIAAICILEALAILNGIDGAYLALAFTFIGGIAGFGLGKVIS